VVIPFLVLVARCLHPDDESALSPRPLDGNLSTIADENTLLAPRVPGTEAF
jgi:hypothetical protein